MKRAKLSIVLLISLILFISCKKESGFDFRQRETNFNANWKFFRADTAGAENPEFNDSDWRTLTLPHDYSIEDLPEKEGVKQIGPFSEESAGGRSTGQVVGGTAWYRKHFTLNKTDKGKTIQILFDGIYMNSDVWLNGHHLGNQPYGYSAFHYDLTKYLHPAGKENILAVQVKNKGENSRWYSGSGIYRNVKLIKTNPVHIPIWGVFITTPKVNSDKAVVFSEVKIVNRGTKKQDFKTSVKILDSNGEVATSSEANDIFTIDNSSEAFVKIESIIKNPNLWDTQNPNLYTAIIQIKKGEEIVDEKRIRFGIRSIEFSPLTGFLLNGKTVLLKGGCVHHDNGILGSATFERAEFRRVQILKENGFNAIRCAHNPPSEAFLRACDEMGMLVLDESFDQWQVPKKPQDYNLYFDDWWEHDLEAMVLRDRNHPSVIIWSVGNEISERGFDTGLEIFDKLKKKVKEMDTTRPVTQAVCSFWEHPGKPWEDTEPVFAQLDVHGYNYKWQNYETDHQKFPGRIIIGTESFPSDAFENWQMAEKHAYVLGDFVWTGMDYFGEAAIGNAQLESEKTEDYPDWPWYNAYCGNISILGYKKPQMYFRDVVWRNSDLEMLVHAPIPEGDKEFITMWGWPNEWKSWNWQGSEGKPIRVNVYSRCEQVRLELNGKEIATKPVSEKTKLTAQFEFPYQPGELTAIGLVKGKEIVKQSISTAGVPAKLRITAENEEVYATSMDLAYFNVEVLDENGLLVPNANLPIAFDIDGKCELQAVGNGNPKDVKSFKQPKVNTFRGKCQLIVRSCKDGDKIVVTANSEGLKSDVATVTILHKK